MSHGAIAVPADASFLFDKAAVPGDAIKGTQCLYSELLTVKSIVQFQLSVRIRLDLTDMNANKI